ncbi:MAG: alpha/beta hydrolase [Lachnospiraceae bacterium]|nr:alpha/beta hydrolase [Lachnospiraceae bacterium]
MEKNTDNDLKPRTHMSASAALYTGVLSLVPAGAKFKAGAETTRRRIENIRKRGEKRYEYPHLCPDADISESEICGIRTYILQREKRGDRVLVYIHGGGFVQEMLPMHWFFLDDIAAMTGAAVYIPIYPLAPFCTYRDLYPKIIDYYREIARDNPGCKMILSGDSAGGNIAAVIAENLSPDEQPDELILLSPALSMHVDPIAPDDIESFNKCLLVGVEAAIVLGEYWAGGRENMNSPLVSPIDGDVSPLRSVTIYAGERDMAYAMSLRFAEKLSEAGVKTETVIGKGMPHVWPVMSFPEAHEARRQIAEIIRR